jgi:hypothetical protein
MNVHSASLRACRMMEAPFRSLNHTSAPVLNQDRKSEVHPEAVVARSQDGGSWTRSGRNDPYNVPR